MNKIYETPLEALHDIYDNMTLLVGGFGLCGIPEKLIETLKEKNVKNLTCVSNNAGVTDFGLGLLLQTKQVKKMISSYVGENDLFAKQFMEGELKVEFCPQGTLAERIRAAGAGIPAFYTPTGVGTKVAEGKEIKEFDKRTYVLEKAIKADASLIKAYKADPYGNLIYSKTARNFNPIMAQASHLTIAEVEEIVPLGELDPDQIHTPGVFVQRIVVTKPEKRIEQRIVKT